jgi:hypothetical protein
MPFNLPVYETRTFEKTNFMRLDQGTHIVRFIDAPEDAVTILTHFVMGKYTIVCPGEDCPVCASNKQLIYAFPDNFRDQKGYSPKVTGFLVNVLDRTVAKVCSCGAEVKAGGPKNTYPPTCPECNTFIHDITPKPLNVVKVLKFGVQLATQLNTIERATCDPEGNPIGINNFDLVLSVEGVKQKKVITPIPTGNRDVVDIPEELKQNLDNAMIKLSSHELSELLNGVSLKDIYTARRNSQRLDEIKNVVSEAVTGTSEVDKDTEEIRDALSKLL